MDSASQGLGAWDATLARQAWVPDALRRNVRRLVLADLSPVGIVPSGTTANPDPVPVKPVASAGYSEPYAGASSVCPQEALDLPTFDGRTSCDTYWIQLNAIAARSVRSHQTKARMLVANSRGCATELQKVFEKHSALALFLRASTATTTVSRLMSWWNATVRDHRHELEKPTQTSPLT